MEVVVEGKYAVRKTHLLQLRSTGTFMRKKIWKDVYMTMDGELKIFKAHSDGVLHHEVHLLPHSPLSHTHTHTHI